MGPAGRRAPGGRRGAGGGGDVGVVRADESAGWTDKLPEDCRPAADEISAARPQRAAGTCGTWPVWSRRSTPASLPENPDRGKDDEFEDRSVKLETTFDGAGVLAGDLTPECAAVVATVLDALSAPAGAEDTRTQAQRCHDGLQEAMRRLVAADLLPERAGQPVKVWAHISLADLMVLDGQLRAAGGVDQPGPRPVGRRTGREASVGGSDGGAWLDGDAAEAIACDAAMAPIVTGDVNPAALDDLVRLCVDLDRLRHHGTGGADAGSDSAARRHGTGTDGDGEQGAPSQDTALAWEALERAIIGKAVDLLSGPGGLASFLRRRQLGARLGGPSLPLDIGYSETIPAGIRNAVILRDKHCQWAGKCNQPASACEVHHVKHKKNGGATSVKTAFCSASSTTRW